MSRLPSRARLSSSDFASAGAVLDEPKPVFLVEGMLYPGAPFSIFGLPDSGKSLIALLLAVCLVARKPFLARAVNVTGPRSVVYVAAEGKRFVGARLRAICERYGITKDDLADLHIVRRPIAITDLIEVERFVDVVKALTLNRPPLALIILDTLTKCLGRAGANENDPRDMALLADRIDAITEATGAAVGFVDHTGWEGKHERGHSNKRGNVETAMLVTRDGKDKNIITLGSEKANHSDGFTPIRLRIEARADAAVVVLPAVEIVDLTPTGQRAARHNALRETDLKALHALANEPAGLPFTRWQIASGVPKSTLDRLRPRLLGLGFVEQQGPEHKWRYALTAEGIECLEASG